MHCNILFQTLNQPLSLELSLKLSFFDKVSTAIEYMHA